MAANISPHARLTALLLCWPLGLFGAHRFHLGKTGTGLLQLVTLGGLQVWTLIDFVVILAGRFTDSHGRPVKQWTTQGAELHLVPIVIVAAATSVLASAWIGMLVRSPAPGFAETILPLVVVQATGGVAIGFAVRSHRFLHGLAASDAGEGAGLAAMLLSGLLYLVTPVAGLLSLVGGAARDAADPDAAD